MSTEALRRELRAIAVRQPKHAEDCRKRWNILITLHTLLVAYFLAATAYSHPAYIAGAILYVHFAFRCHRLKTRFIAAYMHLRQKALDAANEAF